nr:amino acid adenylation domain-containing protein [Streptomyces sp. SID12501]
MRILWEILEIDADTASPEENFYDVGGTSLQAMRVCSRLQQDLGVPAVPEQLFESETIAEFLSSLIPTSPEPTSTSTSAGGLIHEGVTRAARLTPDAMALVHGDQRISYAQLESGAEAYAKELRRLGIGPGTSVPVILRRSVRLVAVLLGVLKCGAAYAALDPRWPAPRLEQLIRTLNPPVTVADTSALDAGAPVWMPDASYLEETQGAAPAQGQEGFEDTAVSSVFFTSGTTGTPKGVLSTHRATMRLFSEPTFADFRPGRVMLQAAPVSWDAFSLELWGMLTTGGTSVITTSDYLLPAELRRLIETAGVDTVWLTSSLLNLFVDEDIRCFAGLRQVLTGGEKLSAPHVRRFVSAHPGITLINGYGPVESCVFATTHRVRPADCDEPHGIPIGRAVRGTRIHLLDGSDPVPAGEVGEICLSGDGLARSYLGDARATAERFVSLPLDGVATRLYRTGDFGTLDHEGILHFRGRADRQLKVSGHRIEPAEIEAATRAVPGVLSCAIAHETGPDGVSVARLALFYTVDSQHPAPPTPTALRRAIAGVLPRHMVPSQIELLDALPLTTHGKLDRSALLPSLADHHEQTAGSRK